MRFMVLVKADKSTEAGVMPTEKELTEMGKFNEELVKAGVMLAGEGLHPTSKGARVRFDGKKRTVIDGTMPSGASVDQLANVTVYNAEIKNAAGDTVLTPAGTLVTDTYGPSRFAALRYPDSLVYARASITAPWVKPAGRFTALSLTSVCRLGPLFKGHAGRRDPPALFLHLAP